MSNTQLQAGQLVVSEKRAVTLNGRLGTGFNLAKVQRNGIGETVAVHIGSFFAPKAKASDADCIAAAEDRI